MRVQENVSASVSPQFGCWRSLELIKGYNAQDLLFTVIYMGWRIAGL
jgi:hypothetical protein